MKIVTETDPEKQKLAGMNMHTKFLPGWFGAFEKRLAAREDRNFLVGDKLSIADFAWATFFYSFVFNELNEHHGAFEKNLSEFPLLKEYAENLGKTFADYLASRPKRDH